MVLMIRIRRDEPNSLRVRMAPIRVAQIGRSKLYQRLDGGMDISEQAQPREDETGLDGPGRYEDAPHGQAAQRTSARQCFCE
jgi:hypothetical protein